MAKRQRRKADLAWGDQSARVGELEDFEIPGLKLEPALEHLTDTPHPG